MQMTEIQLPEPAPGDTFWSQVMEWDGADDSCWVWTGPLNKDGYGKFIKGGGTAEFGSKQVHRHAYELLVGRIPQGMTLHHGCERKNCCRPDHLEPITRGEHSRLPRSTDGTRKRSATCKHGHLKEGSNLYEYKGAWVCRTCVRTAGERYRSKKRMEKMGGDSHD